MNILKAANLFYKLSGLFKLAFISSGEAISNIKSQISNIAEIRDPQYAERYLYLFEQAFHAHDELYSVIDQTLNTGLFSRIMRRKSFDRVAEDAMKNLIKLVEFLKDGLDQIEAARIEGRFNVVATGFNDAMEYYYRYIEPNQKLPSNAADVFSFKFHSRYHGLLEYLLNSTLPKSF
jgi:hypothetical protein